MKCLIAEDSQDMAEIMAFGARLTWPDWDVLMAGSGSEALNLFAKKPPDLVVLDVSMPPPDGFEVCRRIRETSQVPILMLTVHDATVDKVRALDLGADDYLTKPFDHLELLARFRALIRRGQTASMPMESISLGGDLSINWGLHEVRVRREMVRLTSTEFRLLHELVHHAGQVLTHDQLLEQVWEPQYIGDTHYLKVFVRRLREKLSDDAEPPRYIHTEWGVGYHFMPPDR